MLCCQSAPCWTYSVFCAHCAVCNVHTVLTRVCSLPSPHIPSLQDDASAGRWCITKWLAGNHHQTTNQLLITKQSSIPTRLWGTMGGLHSMPALCERDILLAAKGSLLCSLCHSRIWQQQTIDTLDDRLQHENTLCDNQPLCHSPTHCMMLPKVKCVRKYCSAVACALSTPKQVSVLQAVTASLQQPMGCQSHSALIRCK